MNDESIKELSEIADFISNRIDTLMPILKNDFEGTRTWPLLQIGGAYLHFWRECRMSGETEIKVIHQYSLSRILAMPQLQEAMSMAMASAAHQKATGVRKE